jgi:hypothetical protein
LLRGQTARRKEKAMAPSRWFPVVLMALALSFAAPAAAAGPTKRTRARTAPSPPAASPPAASPPVASPKRPAGRAHPVPSSPPRSTATPRPATPWLAVEAGIDPAARSLRFPANGTAPVGYSVVLGAPPRLRLEIYPLHPAGGLAAGLGLFAEGTNQAGIGLPAGAAVHHASLVRLRAGLLWRLQPGDRLVLVPSLAWERESFLVGPAGGLRVPGLPDSRLEGGSAGLGLELPLSTGRVTLLAGGRFTWWLRAGELAGGAAYFPAGRALGLEAWAGAGVTVIGPLSVRLLGTAAVTQWSLGLDPSGAYTVRSARADSLGGQIAVRLAW